MMPTKFSAFLWSANYCLCLLTFHVCFLPFKAGKIQSCLHVSDKPFTFPYLLHVQVCIQSHRRVLYNDKGCVNIKNLTTTPPPPTTTSTTTTLLWYWCQMHRDIVGGNVKNEKRSQNRTWPKVYSIWVILCIVRRAENSNRQAGEAKDEWEAAKPRKIHRLR